MDYVNMFKEKINDLTGNTHSYHRIREVDWNKSVEISYRCFKYYSQCRAKCTVVLDLNNKLANIYENGEKHNHPPGFALRNIKVCLFINLFHFYFHDL
jgi:hypothetical protein